MGYEADRAAALESRGLRRDRRRDTSQPGGFGPGLRNGGPRGSLANYIDRMRYVDAERNAKLHEQRGLQAREEFIKITEEAAAKNPEIDQQVFIDILNAYDAEFNTLRDQSLAIHRDSPNRGTSLMRHSRLYSDVVDSVEQRIAHHGEAGKAAMKAISAEKQPESIFTSAIKLVYNSERGGVQIGGMIGAGLAGAASYMITGNAGMGGLMQMGATAAVALIGAYAGTQLMPQARTHEPVKLRDKLRTPSLARTRDLAANAPDKAPEELLAKSDASAKPDTSMKKTGIDKALEEYAVNSSQIKPAELTGSEEKEFRPDSLAATSDKSDRAIT
jgi:hypothetical protein